MTQQPTTKTIKRLFAASGNRCAFPGCDRPLVTGPTVTGEICHICARNPGGPRHDPAQSDAERHAFENLLLLCGDHHKIIDADPAAYTVEQLLQYKTDHETHSTSAPAPTDSIANQLLRQINIGGDVSGQVGIVGDGARVEGGIHFHAPSLPTPPLSVDHIPTLPHPPAPLKPASGSPFIVGRPLRASEPIFGREPAFRFIAGELAKFSSVNIVGERRMGKTSLLNHLVGRQDEHLVPQPDHPPLVLARLDLQASITSQVWFYGTGLRELLDNLPPSRSSEALAFGDLRTRLHARPRANYHQFERALRQLRDPRGICVRPVLIVDEFERLLAPAAEEGFPFPGFFDGVRALITADLLAMIVASRRPLAEYFCDPARPDSLTSTFPNYFTPFTLSPLDEQAADALLLQPSDHRLTVQETAQAKRWAGGHPCHLQVAGQACYEAQAGGHAPTWARERFDELESQSCMTGQVAGKESRLGRLWRVLRCAPRAIFLDFFIAIGRLAQHLGARFDDVAAWLIGAAIILILLLLLFGVAKGSDLLDIIKQGLGL